MAKVRARVRAGSNNFIVKVVAVVVALVVLAAGTIITGFVSRDASGKWFKNSDLSTWSWKKNTTKQPVKSGTVYDENGRELTADETHLMPRSMVFVSTLSEEVSNKVDAIGPTVTVTATQSFELNNVQIDWSIEYPNGTDASDVVTVTPESDGSLKATVQYIKSFGQKLTLKASVRGGDEFVTCAVDCVKRISQIQNYWFAASDFGDPAEMEFDVDLGVGTVAPDVSVLEANFYIDTDFQASVKSYLKFDITFKAYTETNYTTSNYKTGSYAAETSTEFDYEMLIKDWHGYDEAHQTAIKYAWYRAYRAWDKEDSLVLTDLKINLTYKGQSIGTIVESEIPGQYNASLLSGELDGSELKPNLTLNYNIAL